MLQLLQLLISVPTFGPLKSGPGLLKSQYNALRLFCGLSKASPIAITALLGGFWLGAHLDETRVHTA